MRALFRNISNRSNSTSEAGAGAGADAEAGAEAHTARIPFIPPLSPIVAQGFPGITTVPTSSRSRPIAVPAPRRQSEPVERWARPTLPSYAASTSQHQNQPLPSHNGTDIPSYEDALSNRPASVPRGGSLEAEDEAVLNWAAREYFGSSPPGPGQREQGAIDGDSALDTSEEGGTGEGNVSQEGDDTPLIPRTAPPTGMQTRRYTTGGQFAPHLPDRRHTSFSTPLGASDLSAAMLDIPAPTMEPPLYSSSLGQDEMRLISTVHLADDHPAAAFFNALASPPGASGSGSGSANADANIDSGGVRNITTGGKKMRVTLKKGERPNANGTGPISIRVGRGGAVEGTVEIGKVDHAYGLEVAIVGLVNVQYYIRGQYTVVDTLPLARRKAVLFPPASSSNSGTPTTGPPEAASNSNTQGSAATPSTAPASDIHTATSATPAAPDAEATETTNLASPTAPSLTAAAAAAKSKDNRPYIQPGSTFSFSLKMPTTHFRESRVELPPTCDLQQVGLQANVEYMLKVKMSRKGWRWNDELTIPINYEPRAYIPPGRLRSLTWDDPLNPGWRTVNLHGGKPISKHSFSLSTPPQHESGPGVEVTLLLPSPPILFVSSSADFPTFPFHLHFHSELPHPLATFSNPAESKFLIRLTRVAMMRVGLERETRRLEIPTKVELWQEGGERMTLGPLGEGVVASDIAAESRRGSAVVGSPDGNGNGIGIGIAGPASLPDSVGGGSLRRFSSPSSVGGSTPTERRRPSFSSLMRRRNSSSSQAPPAAGSAGTGTFSPGSLPSALPPIIREEHEHEHEHEHDEHEEDDLTHNGPNGHGPSRGALAPLSLSSTDVHLHGSITIESCTRSHADIMRRLVQSFNTPELTLTYIVEVTVVPRKGAVKEAFGHVWGGGIVEVVLGQGVRNR